MTGAQPGAAPLTIMHVLAPAAVGGLESVVRLLSGGHRRAGHTTYVVALESVANPGHPLYVALAGEGVEVVRLVLPGRSYHREWAAVSDLCHRLRPSIVHTHGYRPDVVAAGAARRAGVATVTTLHGFTKGDGGDRKAGFYLWLQRRALRRFDAVVAVSRPIAASLRSAGIRQSRLHVVPNAYDSSRAVQSRIEARRTLGIGEGFQLGWVGRLSQEKGADLFLEALAKVSDLNVTASIVGDGVQRPALEARARELGIAHRVRWHGIIPDASTVFSAFDGFVLSSRTEGTPVALFEAMASGVPIVATAVGGVPDVISGEEAIIVPTADGDSIAAGINRLLADARGAAARALEARHRLERQFGMDSWLERYERIYRGVQRPPTDSG